MTHIALYTSEDGTLRYRVPCPNLQPPATTERYGQTLILRLVTTHEPPTR